MDVALDQLFAKGISLFSAKIDPDTKTMHQKFDEKFNEKFHFGFVLNLFQKRQMMISWMQPCEITYMMRRPRLVERPTPMPHATCMI